MRPKLLSSDLLDLVASYFNLKEKDYFGLAFLDETNHFNWLQLEKRVLDHDFPSKSGILTLYFRVQFFMESINQLRDSITIELFYLQAKESVFKGEIEADSETVFELGAYVLQATEGDYTSDQKAHKVLKKLPVLPQFTLREHPSLAYCEERILFYYKRLGGLSSGQCIVW
ncbi:FERM domain-containing protein 4A-like [Lytechinus pictus]|uniref:FERM domain-containing protein 4A-like n=1 Tax=Lytechinus pictus TaxID=7653 RepID=UPI0030B9FE40